MGKYQNNYRIDITRLKDWDYSTPWWYYVTINIEDHKDYFIVMSNHIHGIIILNEINVET
jgi:hypothetical protein